MSPDAIAVWVGVLGASFAGSPHCAAMCGGFVTFAASSKMSQAGYHLGRLATYALLGSIAGAIGGGVESASRALGLGQIAPLVAGALMVAFGIASLVRSPTAHFRLPFTQALARIILRLERAPRHARAFVVGLSTTLIPCGWLYAFAIAAGGTQSAAKGALLMAVFWLGTVPVLAGMGLLMKRLWRPLERYRPKISAIALVVLGLLSIAGRMPTPASSISSASTTANSISKEPICHGRGSSDL